MTETYPVQVSTSEIEVAGDRPIIFHGVNKSGSLAMSNVLREAYYAEGRAQQFFSHYRGIPKHFDDLVRLMTCSTGHRFFVGHYLYRGVEPPPGTLLVTQVRHPLPRTLSVYGWLRRNWERNHGTMVGMPDLESWLTRGTRGPGHTQMAQLAVGYPPDRKEKLLSMTTRAMSEVAMENLERDFAWVGVAEHFEESIFALAHMCGLDAVPPWEKDTRNQWRQSLEETDTRIIDIIQERQADELAFYKHAVSLFRRRIERVEFGPSLDAYKERCSGAYGERIMV